MSDEEVLSGGSVSHVVRVGNTVRRPAGPWTSSVHALLRHLESVNYAFAPRVLGVDEVGREVLTFLSGTPMMRPWPEGLRELDVLDQVGQALRLLADSVASFVPPHDAHWQAPTPGRTGSVRHGDVGPWNTIFDDARLAGFIDWDFAEPAPRLWDLAQAAWYFVPLRPEALGWRAAGFAEAPDLAVRLARLCDAFGERAEVVLDELMDVQQLELQRTQSLGGRGLQPWKLFLDRGDIDELQQEIDWLRDHRGRLVSHRYGTYPSL